MLDRQLARRGADALGLEPADDASAELIDDRPAVGEVGDRTPDSVAEVVVDEILPVDVDDRRIDGQQRFQALVHRNAELARGRADPAARLNPERWLLQRQQVGEDTEALRVRDAIASQMVVESIGRCDVGRSGRGAWRIDEAQRGEENRRDGEGCGRA